MGSESDKVPRRLAEIVADFQMCQGREKLEYLLEFSESLRPLPARLQGQRDEMEQVHECMSPVFISVESDGSSSDDTLVYHFDVPAESPTVRGFAALLQEGADGLTAEQVLAIPHDFYLTMGLQSVLTGQRLNGLGAILAYMKRLAAESLAQPPQA